MQSWGKRQTRIMARGNRRLGGQLSILVCASCILAIVEASRSAVGVFGLLTWSIFFFEARARYLQQLQIFFIFLSPTLFTQCVSKNEVVSR